MINNAQEQVCSKLAPLMNGCRDEAAPALLAKSPLKRNIAAINR